MIYSWFEQFADMSFSEIMGQLLIWMLCAIVGLTFILLFAGVSSRQSKFVSSSTHHVRRPKAPSGADSGIVSLSQPVTLSDASAMMVAKSIKNDLRSEVTQPKSVHKGTAQAAEPAKGRSGIAEAFTAVEPHMAGRSETSTPATSSSNAPVASAGLAGVPAYNRGFTYLATQPDNVSRRSGAERRQSMGGGPVAENLGASLGIPGIPDGNPGVVEQMARDAQIIKDSGPRYGMRGHQATGFFDMQRVRMMRYRVIDELLNMRGKIIGEIEMKRKKQAAEIDDMRRKFISEKAEAERRLESDIATARRRIDSGEKP